MLAKAFAFITLLCFETLFVIAQVKIGAAGNPNPSAVLELDGGGTKGILIPKITTVQRGFLPNPAQGLLVYQTDGVTGFYVNKSSNPGVPNWSLLSEGGSFWQSTALPNSVVNTNSGNVGIGVIPALAGLQVDAKTGAVNALFGSNTTGVAIESSSPGIGFNSYYNAGRKAINTGFGSLVGQDPSSGLFYILTSPASVTGQGTAMPLTERFVISSSGRIGIEGNTDPKAPLSFASNIGNKIALWGDASAPHYGLGMQGSLMQLYASDVNADIAFGYGSSTAFTERMRIKGNGNVGIGIAPTEKLHVSGNAIVTGDQQIGGVLKIAGGNPDAGDILTAISNDGTAGWRLPNAGRYAFHVSYNSGSGAPSTLKFNANNANVDFIEDFVFNIATQRFTAPADGLYEFKYCVWFVSYSPTSSSGIYELKLSKNNISADNLIGSFENGAFVSGTLSGSTILRLNANDQVTLGASSSSALVVYGSTTAGNFFSGYRLK